MQQNMERYDDGREGAVPGSGERRQRKVQCGYKTEKRLIFEFQSF